MPIKFSSSHKGYVVFIIIIVVFKCLAVCSILFKLVYCLEFGNCEHFIWQLPSRARRDENGWAKSHPLACPIKK